MTGYQEILTDPSYCRQIVTLTYPHIGNTGVNAEDVEVAAQSTPRAWSSATCRAAHRTGAASEDLSDYLRDATASSPSPTSTRASSRACCARRARRTAASMAGAGSTTNAALAAAQALPGLMAGMDLAKVVSVHQALRVERRRAGRWARAIARSGEPRFHVVAYDYGIKRNILRMLAERGCRVTVRAGADAGARRAGDEARRRVPRPTARAIRSPATTRSRRSARSSTHRHAGVRHLPRPPAAGPRLGREDDEDEVRPPRRQPSGAGPATPGRW